MLTAEQVPKECLVAYQRAFKAGGGPADGIAAAINAWPGMVQYPVMEIDCTPPKIILPLAKEKT